MLELKNIIKVYPSAGEDVKALKGVSLTFRDSEFVSILGPSGCGKTTMLNIIGGLDRCTSGDLVINGKSTEEYGDRDWDTYRNHSVGFVFQTYNLIPHQSVLRNVELALTLSGVGKKERKERAVKALETVGLGNQLNKKPNQMSGGQMQRVAIARAIVNNPDIILADEPTGALDTETSIQVMDILKEIAKDRLVIMVTHNPDLAEQYSTRIVRMLDGEVTDDTMPLGAEEYREQEQVAVAKAAEEAKKKKPSMKLRTAFGLSLKNLFSKKGRTVLTSVAGSIGIIGIALIYAVSQGTTNFINMVQEQTLAAYPLSIESQTVSLSSLISSFSGKAESIEPHENDAVYQKAMMYELINAFNSIEADQNDLKAFKKYIEEQRKLEGTKLAKSLTGVKYSYNTDLLVYTLDVDGKIIRSDTQALMASMMGGSQRGGNSGSEGGQADVQTQMMASSYSGLWEEMIPGPNGEPVADITKDEYDLLYGHWPQRYDEIVLFLDKNNELSDLTLYALGLKSDSEIREIMLAAMKGETIEYTAKSWSYEEICSMDFRTILTSDCFTYDGTTGRYTDLRTTEAGMKYLYDHALKLRVAGIVRPNPDAVAGGAGGNIGYTHQLTEYIITHAYDAPSAKAQTENQETDIFTGLPFRVSDGEIEDSEKIAALKDYAGKMDETAKAEAYVKIMSKPSDAMLKAQVDGTLGMMSRTDMENALVGAMAGQTGMDEETVKAYVASMSEEDMKELIGGFLTEQFAAKYAEEMGPKLAALSREEKAQGFDMTLLLASEEELAAYYDAVVEFSKSTYEDNLRFLGCLDLDSPSTVSLYTDTFANKDLIKEAIADYNKSVDEVHEITYTDVVGLIMSSVTTVINAITYVLIAFVSVSLIVSSIMIGVITLISVQERTKEIGILRAIGASKKNVSSMFNAETVLIGFASGLFGVTVTYLLCIPINLLLHALTDINNLSASLPIPVAIALIVVSMLLTLLAGIIPSRSAARKDPVVALRTE